MYVYGKLIMFLRCVLHVFLKMLLICYKIYEIDKTDANAVKKSLPVAMYQANELL